MYNFYIPVATKSLVTSLLLTHFCVWESSKRNMSMYNDTVLGNGESNEAADGDSLSDNYEGSNGSHGGCNTGDNDLTLPNYMTHVPPSNDLVSQVYMLG